MQAANCNIEMNPIRLNFFLVVMEVEKMSDIKLTLSLTLTQNLRSFIHENWIFL